MNESQVQEEIGLDSLVGRVADEFLRRQEAGEKPDVEEYAARHPEAAELLRKVLTSLCLIDRSVSPLAPASGERGGGEGATGTLGDFRILREVGRGGMGVVYEAEQVSLGRRVALKVLPFAATMDPRHIQRFQNEARAAASLHHTNIVPVFGVGLERGVHYYAMQFIEGETLARLIKDFHREDAKSAKEEEATQPYPPPSRSSRLRGESSSPPSTLVALTTEKSITTREFFRSVAQLAIQAAEALEYVHQMGVIHRDIKPANLMVDGRANLWVTDFGLAQMASPGGDAGGNLTMTGDLLGTLRYMSPEQALANRVIIDQRTDIYSLGVTLYEMLTLQAPFAGENRQELLRQIAFEEPKAPRRINRHVPAELETIVLKAMEKNPEDRYTRAQELADDFGSGGIVTTSFGSLFSQIHSLGIETVNGNAYIVAVGVARDANYNGQYAVARYNPNGSLDSSFGNSGEVLIPVVGGYQALAVLVQPWDQKIIVGGDGGVALVRLTTGGQLDSTFGAGGIAQPGIGNEANALALDSNGNVVVAGDGPDPTAGKEDFLVARFGTGTSPVPAGSLDTTFGGGLGYVLTHISTQHAYARGVAIQNNGLIVAAGAANYSQGTTPSSALACYTASGSLDSSFGSGGVLYPTFGGGSQANGEQGDYAVTIQPTSSTSYRLVAVSSVSTKTGASFGVAAYLPDSSVQPVLEASAPLYPVQQTVTAQQLQPVVQTAIADWQAAGASAAQVTLLEHVPVSISPLPSGYLGSEANNQVWISPNAAGWGWNTGNSLPPKGGTPTVGVPASAGGASAHMDLLSVVAHEFGHVLGLGDSDNLQDEMGDTLAAGVRRLPTWGDLHGTANEPEASATVLVQVLSERLRTSPPIPYASGSSRGSSGLLAGVGAAVLVEPSGVSAAASLMKPSAFKSTAALDKLFALREINPLEDMVG